MNILRLLIKLKKFNKVGLDEIQQSRVGSSYRTPISRPLTVIPVIFT